MLVWLDCYKFQKDKEIESSTVFHSDSNNQSDNHKDCYDNQQSQQDNNGLQDTKNSDLDRQHHCKYPADSCDRKMHLKDNNDRLDKYFPQEKNQWSDHEISREVWKSQNQGDNNNLLDRGRLEQSNLHDHNNDQQDTANNQRLKIDQGLDCRFLLDKRWEEKSL